MIAPTSRSLRRSAPVRDLSFANLVETEPDANNSNPLNRTRGVSPSSVRCFPEKAPNQSLASSIKSQEQSLAPSVSSLLQSRRKVGFAPWVGVKNTISRSEMTEEEKEDYWLQGEDYTRIRRRNRMLIQRAETFHSLGEPLPCKSDRYDEDDCEDDIESKQGGDYLCIRGLEKGSKSESLRKKADRRNSIQRVLIEQEFQCLQEFHDDENIRQLYIEVTSPCKFRAVHMAMEDRIAVEDYYRSGN